MVPKSSVSNTPRIRSLGLLNRWEFRPELATFPIFNIPLASNIPILSLMVTHRTKFLALLVFSSINFLKAQTTLNPGDVIPLSLCSNMGLCSLPQGTDEISFVFFQDLTNGTEFMMTDNGWETANPGYWGDGEGVLQIT